MAVAIPKTYKDGYRDQLDRLGPGVGEETIIDESIRGFDFNRRLFEQLADRFACAS